MEYYAKSPEFVPVVDKEGKITEYSKVGHKKLKEHLEDTVRCAEKFFKQYGSYFSEKEKKLVIDACRLHDIGKANYIFQTKVNPALNKTDKTQIPHGFLSAVILSKKAFLNENPQYTSKDFNILLTAIYYHHSRSDIYDAAQLKEYCEQFYLNHVREYLHNDDVALHLANINSLLFSDQRKDGFVRPEEDTWCQYMLVKGMLNKFDWTVSAGEEDAEIATDIVEKKLCRNIEKKWSGCFNSVQKFMMENRKNNVVMIAPTGSGKTEAALLWFHGEKGFYTLPLKVSSNAIYKRINENYQYEDVALLHSDSVNSYLESAEDLENGYKNYEKAKRFSYPLTVCTVDQLFRFVYKALGTEIFAATLKYSKIVIDEIQSYSPRVVAALIFGLSEIRHMGGKFAIITATFPPVLQYFMKISGLLKGEDYVWHDFSDDAAAKRHRLKVVDGDLNIKAIVEEASNKKVLIICNTVSKAQSIYGKLKEEGLEPGLLHSRFIREHRNLLEKKIMEFSADETESGIWVTTQIVEASLDIDFDVLHTEMCTADSLLQRMGRCNRAGKKDTTVPNIIVYNNGSGKGTVYDKDIYDRSVDLLRAKEGKLFSESDKTAYINAVYDVEQIRRTKYFKQIEKNMECFRSLSPAEYDAGKAQEDFRAIRSVTVIPDVVYNQNLEEIEDIRDLLNMPHIDRSIRKLKKSRLADMTLSLNVRYKLPAGIDKETIGVFDIHWARLKYDFDGNTGLGLLLDKIEDEDCFL